MANELFHQHFPEVAKAETRSMTLPAESDGVPAGQYGFLESYCTDPDCDCRRVLLHILRNGEGVIAVVSFAFDPGTAMRGPFLDPMHPRPTYGKGLLALVREVLLSDPDYVARLERHYQMVKQKLAQAGEADRVVEETEETEEAEAAAVVKGCYS